MSGEDPTEPLDGGQQSAEPMPAGGEDPTEALAGELETGQLAAGDDAPTEQQPRESWAPHQPEVKSGTGILIASILASAALIFTYVFAGGLDFKPTPVGDPCDSRAWSDPSGLEDTAQQIAFSALDGAACDLGVSREELTRAIATPESQEDFLKRNDISEDEFSDALRAGITRAADDAENAGAIDPLVASGIRTAVRVLPVQQLIPLIQDASGLLEGGSGLADLFGGGSGSGSGLGGIIDSLGDLFGGGGTGGSGLEDLIPGNPQDLRDQLPPEIEQNLPKGIEDDIGNQIQQALDSLLNP